MPKVLSILSATSMTGYNIAKFLILMLEPLAHNQFTIKDSFNFAKEIKTYDSSLYMNTLHVESLFTNIPLNQKVNNFVSDLHKENL